MSKKNFTGGLSTLLGEETEKSKRPKKGRPVTQKKVVNKSSEEGTKEGEIRATFIVNTELLDKVKSIAYWERLLIKDVINKAFGEYVSKYEKSKGEIVKAPKRGE